MLYEDVRRICMFVVLSTANIIHSNVGTWRLSRSAPRPCIAAAMSRAGRALLLGVGIS